MKEAIDAGVIGPPPGMPPNSPVIRGSPSPPDRCVIAGAGGWMIRPWMY
jgi:hypothetical protein